MNDHKLDSALAAALLVPDEAGGLPLTVFLDVAIPLDDQQKQMLERWGINTADGAATLTARVPRAAITELAAQAWVLGLSLSAVSRPLRMPRMP
ncbi:hypothetical protein [Janthinobacterium sp. PC23-8]|uniref:hypothetical protein n=1 Tax=Janthinobacterium sp. PC23-8 TaxID=2012679 RepID=UPI000B962886|nr:hypothetical protein [Janthinobacterium sp. PC23-8]OYO26677.1 hypothetical protein CD932_26130 [Janthinobacterium sp. PC23-8]